MDDEQYRQTRDSIDLPPCLYGKALQYGYFTCRHARNITLGEREAVHCQNHSGYINCREFYTLSLDKSGFALGSTQLPTHLTFNKAMQVQIGGLQGAMQLADAVTPENGKTPADSLSDIADCFRRLKSVTPDFKALNFSQIVPHIQKFSLRKRSGR